jgi:hypothetical protein
VGWVAGLPVVELFGVLVGVFGLASVIGVLAFSPVTDCTSRDPELVAALDPFWLMFFRLISIAPLTVNTSNNPTTISAGRFLLTLGSRLLFCSDPEITIELLIRDTARDITSGKIPSRCLTAVL